MAIYLSDPRYNALDQAGFSFGKFLRGQHENHLINKGVDKGKGLLTSALEKNRMLTEANNQMAANQGWLGYVNHGKNLNERWAKGEAAGLAIDSPEMQDIIKESNAWREGGAAKGYNLPGQDVPLANYQSWIDNEYGKRTNPLIEKLAAQGISGLSQYALPNFANRDAGVTERPDFNVNGSMSGIMDAIKKQQAELSDPVNMQMQLTGLNLSPEAMQRLAPAWEAYKKSFIDQQSLDLLTTLMDPNATPEVKNAAMLRLNQINGNTSGTQIRKDLAPKTSTAVEDTGKKINYLEVKGPNAFGDGNITAQAVRSTPKEVSPTSEAQMLQRDKHFWASMDLQGRKLQNDLENDKVKIELAQRNSTLGGFGTLLSDLRGRAGNALRGAQNLVSARKGTDDNYDPNNDTEVQKYMQEYMTLTQQADVISDQLGSVLGVKTGQQESPKSANSANQPRDSISEWIDAARNAGAAPEQIKKALRDKGYGDAYDSYVW